MKILRALLIVFVVFAAVAAYFGYIALGTVLFTAPGSLTIARIAAFALATVAMSVGFTCLLEWDDRRAARQRW